MGGAVNTFSTQTSMAAPGDFHCDPDRVGVNAEKRDAYTVIRAKKPTRSASGVEGSSCKSTPHPAYGSELSTGGGRPRESLIGNGGGAPPVSRFLYRLGL